MRPAPATGEMTSLAERKRRAGQRLIVGFGGHSPDLAMRRFIGEARPAGFILFGRNIEEPAQVRELNRELHSLLPPALPPLLSVDQEGGRVLRIKATPWPAMRTLGNMNHLPTTEKVAVALSEELRAMGFNLDFAPVADVDSNPKNPVIGDRAFSADPAAAARQVAAFTRAMQSTGLIATAKHFPGHGDTHTDSHLTLPVVEKEGPDLERCELVPFRAAIEAEVGMVMSAHVVFPAWDEENPATLSRRILHGILREKLGYSGVICSDDMEMKAVRGRYAVEQQLDLASKATVDLFIVSQMLTLTPELMVETWETLVRLQEEDKVHETLAEASNKRLMALRRRFWKNQAPQPPITVVGSPANKQLVHYVLARGGATS